MVYQQASTKVQHKEALKLSVKNRYIFGFKNIIKYMLSIINSSKKYTREMFEALRSASLESVKAEDSAAEVFSINF